jgi:hypothetical protein
MACFRIFVGRFGSEPYANLDDALNRGRALKEKMNIGSRIIERCPDGKSRLVYHFRSN